jgi:hypothetical protein
MNSLFGERLETGSPKVFLRQTVSENDPVPILIQVFLDLEEDRFVEGSYRIIRCPRSVFGR